MFSFPSRGARHGLKLSGKLNRIEEQERQLMERFSGKVHRDTATEVFKGWIEVDTEKKGLKKKKKNSEAPLGPTETLSPDSEKLAALLDQSDYVVRYKSKKKKKRHRALDLDLANSLGGLKTSASDSPEATNAERKLRSLNEKSTPIGKKGKKSSRKKRQKASDAGYVISEDIEIGEPIDVTDSAQVGAETEEEPKSKKKKQQKKVKCDAEAPVECTKKSKKRKRKVKEEVIQPDSDDYSANSSSDLEVKEHRLAKQIKLEMEKHPNKKFKVVAENLTPFQSKQLTRAGIKLVEKKHFDPKAHKKEVKEFDKIARKLEKAISFDEPDSSIVIEKKKKKKKKQHL